MEKNGREGSVVRIWLKDMETKKRANTEFKKKLVVNILSFHRSHKIIQIFLPKKGLDRI